MNNNLYVKKGAKRQVLLVISVFALSVVSYAQEVINTETHRLEQVADGVYFATGTGDIYTMSNALIIERDDDIVIVVRYVGRPDNISKDPRGFKYDVYEVIIPGGAMRQVFKQNLRSLRD